MTHSEVSPTKRHHRHCQCGVNSDMNMQSTGVVIIVCEILMPTINDDISEGQTKNELKSGSSDVYVVI